MNRCLVFYNKKTKERLLSVTVNGLHSGEIKSTKQLLAYENKLEEKDIEVVFEQIDE